MSGYSYRRRNERARERGWTGYGEERRARRQAADRAGASDPQSRRRVADFFFGRGKPVSMGVATAQGVQRLTLSRAEASTVGSHWSAIGNALDTGNWDKVDRFWGTTVTDLATGTEHELADSDVTSDLAMSGQLDPVDIDSRLAEL